MIQHHLFPWINFSSISDTYKARTVFIKAEILNTGDLKKEYNIHLLKISTNTDINI